MIVDPSAIVAILLGEPEADFFLRRLARESSPQLSAGSWVELAAFETRKLGSRLFGAMYAYVDAMKIVIVPVSVVQARIAHDAYRRYGRGTGHPAKLNFGDCFSYALARETGEPLLFKGDDFTHTDVARAA